ncbi:hypothetical protein JYT83_00900 [bacterium AH-315-F18]|nr:hypothetical protein [bacterium AH-315-F18]
MMFIPLVAALTACGYFWFVSDMSGGLKLLASAIVAAAACMQFTSLQYEVPFAVPVLMQVIVGLWGVIYMKLDQ